MVDGAGAIDVETELRQLQRDIAVDPRLDDGPDHVQVIAGRGDGFGERGDALAQTIEGFGQALGFEHAGGANGVLDGFAGEEAVDEARPARTHCQARGQCFQGAALRQEMQEGFRSAAEDQRGRPVATSRCSIVRA